MQTVSQASGILKVNESRVRQFIYAGRLSAQKIGRDLLIKTEDVLAFAAVERKTGRPIEQAIDGGENAKADR
ncbi:helix-turn-helix domain-containing protein [Candidatus Pacearchaeota archaeon]|nr:helix-turn-helix domain-containing protein [Candidatus Pacearchaeota archaeon]